MKSSGKQKTKQLFKIRSTVLNLTDWFSVFLHMYTCLISLLSNVLAFDSIILIVYLLGVCVAGAPGSKDRNL